MCFLRLSALCLLAASAYAGTIHYECNDFPEAHGFLRDGTLDADRWNEDGWFFQEITQGHGGGGPYDGQLDLYRIGINDHEGYTFSLEWRLLTDAPDSEVDVHNGGAFMIVYGGGVRYHFNMASGLARILRGYPYPTEYFEIEPGVPHTYRLEVYDDDYFDFRIDGNIVTSGVPEDVFPAGDAELLFGAQYYLSEHTTRWDYVRFGTIPEPATGVLLLIASLCVLQLRRGG